MIGKTYCQMALSWRRRSDPAGDYPAGGLVVEAAFTSIADLSLLMPKYRIFPIELLVHQGFELIEKVGRLQIPVLYIHGTGDKLVPHGMSRELCDHTSSPKQLKLMFGGVHNMSAIVGGDEYLKSVEDSFGFAHRAA